jgi:hypothetical protein
VNVYWWILGGCVAIAVFQAWREEHRNLVCKNRRKVLTEIVDEHKRVKAKGERDVDLFGLLISHCDDFGNERDVKYICKCLSETHYDPFDSLRMRYGKRSMKGKLLKFIQDARSSG